MESTPKEFNLQGWLDRTLSALRTALDQHQVGRASARLLNSIVGEVIRSNSKVDEVIIKFCQYGRFVDMGVGRGFKRGSRRTLGDDTFFKKRNVGGQLSALKRKPRPWFSKTKTREVSRLLELLATHHRNLVLNEVERAINSLEKI